MFVVCRADPFFRRAGRFGTKGLALTFVSSQADLDVLERIQARFEVAITEMPAELDKNSYSMHLSLSPVWRVMD